MVRNRIRRLSPIQLQTLVETPTYPMDKQDLIEFAQMRGAPDDVLAALERLPDRRYYNPEDVNCEVGAD